MTKPNISLPTNQTDDDSKFHVKSEAFSGSMDLLLYLIESEELDILNLDLDQLIDQYLEFLSFLTLFPLDDISEFLSMAAHLIYLKSARLIPNVQDDELESLGMEERQRFVEQLLEYQKYRQAVDILNDREQMNLFPSRDEPQLEPLPQEEQDEQIPVSLFQLIDAFSKYLKKPKDMHFAVMKKDIIRVEDKIKELKRLFETNAKEKQLLDHQKNRVTFESLIEKVTHQIEIIVTFLALLELVKQRFIRLTQPELFGTIYIEKTVSKKLV